MRLSTRSLVVIMEDEMAVEVATVGNECMVGMHLFLGGDRIPNKALVQIAGNPPRMNADDLREPLGRLGPLHRVLQKYHQGLMNLLA